MRKQTAPAPTLQQATFAARLTEALEAAKSVGIQAKDVARRLVMDETTLSRYKDASYKSGPPSANRRRALEREMRVPVGYLDRATGDLSLLRKAGEENVDVRREVASDEDVTMMAQRMTAHWKRIAQTRELTGPTLIPLLEDEARWFRAQGYMECYDATLDLIREIRWIEKKRGNS